MNCCNTSTEYEEHCRNWLSLYIAEVITPGKIWSETNLSIHNRGQTHQGVSFIDIARRWQNLTRFFEFPV